ncbi:MAG TPA: hypothetical protein VFE54_14600, partial [Mucilaginibacter sp.]|nr:hypothetical protein [Mucilaginibacter sp.]
MKKICTPVFSFIASAMIVCLLSGFTRMPVEERFKDWNYSPNEVFGLVKLESTSNRSWYKISHLDNQSTRVQEYNAAGIVTNTTILRFFNGKVKMMTSTDQFGRTYETTKYTNLGNDEFMVTTTNTGKNSYLPCKSVKYIYKNNVLSEMQYLSFAGKLCNNANGVAITRFKRYDDKDRFSLVKEQSFYGADGQPVISKSFDCHKVVYERDIRGNELSIAYFGINDEPLTNRYGGYKYRYEYDQNDNNIKHENIGLNEEATANSYGVAKVVYAYKKGFLTQETRYDGKNTIVRASDAGDGIAIVKNEYDE